MDSQQLIDLIEDAGYEARSYSGRGMFGEQCIGFEVESGRQLGAVANIVEVASINYDDVVVGNIARAFKAAKTDSMGRDNVIVYFERFAWPEEAVA